MGRVLGTACICAQPPRNNVPERYGPYGELLFFLFEKESVVLRELIRFGPSTVPHSELLFSLIQKKPALVPDSEAFNSFIGDGFLVPALKGASEASDDVQADNVSNEALHGSGDEISLLARLGGGNSSPELPFCIGHAVPRITRS